MKICLLYTLLAAADYQRAVINSGAIKSINGRKPKPSDIKYTVRKDYTVSFDEPAFHIGWSVYVDRLNKEERK